MILHCLSSTGSRQAQQLQRLARAGDAILFLGTATTLARPGHPGLASWQASGAALYALEEDLRLHGIATTDARVECVDYAGWVSLAAGQSRQLLWR